MKKVLIIMQLALLIALTATQQAVAQSSDRLRYNNMERQWEYAGPNAKPRYNSRERRWEYAE